MEIWTAIYEISVNLERGLVSAVMSTTINPKHEYEELAKFGPHACDVFGLFFRAALRRHLALREYLGQTLCPLRLVLA